LGIPFPFLGSSEVKTFTPSIPAAVKRKKANVGSSSSSEIGNEPLIPATYS
jgi:hypothetical protein